MTNYNLNNKFKLFGSAQKDVQELKRIIPFERRSKPPMTIALTVPYVVQNGYVENEKWIFDLAIKIWEKFKIEPAIDDDVNKGLFLLEIPYPHWSPKTYYKLLIFLERKKLPYEIKKGKTNVAMGGILDDT